MKLAQIISPCRRYLQWLMWVVLSLLFLIAILAGLTRALSPMASRYQPEFTRYLSQQLQLPVHIGDLSLGWTGINPEIDLDDIVVHNSESAPKELIAIRRMALQLNLLESLYKRRLMVKALILENVNVDEIAYQYVNSLSPTKNTALPWDHLQVKINDLNIPAYGKLPALKNFNLSLQLHRRQGKFQIQDDKWVLNAPWLFREPLLFADTDISGQIKFGRQAFSLSIDSDSGLSLPEGDLTIEMALQVPKTGSPTINLDTEGNFKNLTRESVYNYMPIAVLSPGLLAWLDSSILHVNAAQSHFVLKGELDHFPFIHNDGEFLVDTQLEGASLAFESNWPIVTNANGHMVFKGQSMLITANQGEFAGLPLQYVSAKIPVMAPKQPVVLHIGAKVKTDANLLVQAVDQLPLASLKHLSSQLSAKGDTTAAINVVLPLVNVTNPVPKIKGYANLDGVTLAAIKAPKMPLTDLTGTFSFTEAGVTAKQITGLWLGMPVSASLSKGQTEGETQVSASWQVSTGLLKSYLAPNWLRFINGKTSINLQVLASLTDVPSIVLSSNLQGLAVSLPLPLQKVAAAKIPTKVTLSEMPGSAWQVQANYGPSVNLQLTVAQANKQWNLTGFALGWGSSQPRFSANQVSLSLNQPKLDLTPWVDFVQKNLSNVKTTKMTLPIQVQLATQQLIFRSYQLTNANVKVNDNGSLLAANISSKEVTGTVNFQRAMGNKNEQLQINLKQLAFPNMSASSSENMQWQQFPATQFSCQSLQLGKLKLGPIAISLTPGKGGLTISQVKLTDSNLTLNASGSWSWQSKLTQLTGTLSTNSLSQALKELGLSGNMDAKQANAQFKLSWPGAPWQMKIAALQGNASLNVGAGKITGLSQSADASVGLGKLISLLSLEGLMRIGDLTTEGFAFDKVTGQFQFAQGNVTVSNTEIKGVIADLSFQGSINLSQQTYNLTMRVVGRLTSSIPVIATIAGGPIVGAVTWVANKAIVGPAVDNASSSTYKITGTWQKPVITKGGT